jgi:hypothetical protein
MTFERWRVNRPAVVLVEADQGVHQAQLPEAPYLRRRCRLMSQFEQPP